MVVVVVLVLLALAFGIGAVVEGLLWLLLITLALVALAAWWGATKLNAFADRNRPRPDRR
jgi:hypothetical protein